MSMTGSSASAGADAPESFGANSRPADESRNSRREKWWWLFTRTLSWRALLERQVNSVSRLHIRPLAAVPSSSSSSSNFGHKPRTRTRTLSKMLIQWQCTRPCGLVQKSFRQTPGGPIAALQDKVVNVRKIGLSGVESNRSNTPPSVHPHLSDTWLIPQCLFDGAQPLLVFHAVNGDMFSFQNKGLWIGRIGDICDVHNRTSFSLMFALELFHFQYFLRPCRIGEIHRLTCNALEGRALLRCSCPLPPLPWSVPPRRQLEL